MKQGDKVPVHIAGQVVAQATVKETGEGTVTLVVPSTLVVMATRTSIDAEASVPENTEKPVSSSETVITGVDRVNNEGEIVTPNAPRPSAADVPLSENASEGAPQDTPVAQMPPVTPPGQGPTNSGVPVTPVTPEATLNADGTPVAPVEVNPDVADNPPSPA